LFGQKPATQPATGGLFNTGTSGGLFGQPAATTSTSGGLFGQQQTTGATGGLFGQSTTGGLFGQQTANQSGLFGQTSANTGMFGQQQMQPMQPAQPGASDYIKYVADCWDTKNPSCQFKHYFYNLVHPSEVHLYQPEPNEDRVLYDQAQMNNPDPSCMVPVLAVGFEGITKRVEIQEEQLKIQKEKIGVLEILI
jgi:nuclear pore complex protein Nup54